jgi:pyruvate/2-oxoglutarate dehydrogenase complex dihydrolipoamide acyltransferase (E2) component
MLTTFNEVDMSRSWPCANGYKDAFEKKHGVKLGFMSFFVKACVAGLKECRRSTPRSTAGDRLQELLRHRRRRRHAAGPGRAGGA